jgi:hypothetical protein
MDTNLYVQPSINKSSRPSLKTAPQRRHFRFWPTAKFQVRPSNDCRRRTLPNSLKLKSDGFLSVGVSKIVINDQEALAELIQRQDQHVGFGLAVL